MVFAAAGLLIALVVLAVPVWLHLRRSRPTEARPVASLLLLRSGEDPLRAQRTIKDWLLLVLRLVGLLLLILAFAQPVLKEFSTRPAAVSAAPLMVVVDVSASMAPHLQEAVAQARSLLRERSALVTVAAELTVLATPDDAAPERNLALASVEAGTTALDFADLPARLSTLADSMSPPDQQMQIHLISDFQASAIPSRFNALVDGLRHPLTLHQVSADGLPNWWIDSLSASGLTVRSANAAAGDVRVRIVVDGQQVYSETVAVPASGETSVPMPELPGERQAVRIAAYVDPPAVDALSADNGRFFVDRSRSERSVAVIGKPMQQRYVLTALISAAAGRVVEDRSSQLIVAADPTDELPELDTALQNGAAALLFAGGSARTHLAAGFAGVVPRDRLEIPDRSRLNVVDSAHPVSNRLTRSHDLTVFNYLPMAINQGQVLIRLDNGDPWLVELPVGRGRLLLVASSLDPRDSNFAASPAFVGFLSSAISYLADDFVASLVDVGSVLRLPQRGAQIIGADGSRLLSLEQSQGRGSVRLAQPGIYELRSAAVSPAQLAIDATRGSYFAANIPLQESDLTPLTADDLLRWRNAMSVSASSDRAVAAAEASRHFDLPLGRWLLVAALLLLFVESLRANGLPLLRWRSERV